MLGCLAWLVANLIMVNVLELNTFLLLFSIMAEIHDNLVNLANREDPDQTASSEAVWSGSVLSI